MPIYEYECRQCGHVFEELVMGGEDQNVLCPKCRSKRVGKLISRTGSFKKRSAGLSGADRSCAPGRFS